MLEANLSFQNGLVLPLLSEFLEYDHGDMENNKQDCEQRVFKRLAERLKTYFPRLPIVLLLDGLYANGPIMEQRHKYYWQFMIVLKDDSLSTVWEEFYALLKLTSKNNYNRTWGTRRQPFKWVNQIEYYYGANECNKITVHVVTCDEVWEEVDEQGEIVTKHSHHAWISSRASALSCIAIACELHVLIDSITMKSMKYTKFIFCFFMLFVFFMACLVLFVQQLPETLLHAGTAEPVCIAPVEPVA